MLKPKRISYKALQRNIVLFLELSGVLAFVLNGWGGIQDFLAWITGWQFVVIFFFLIIRWVAKHKFEGSMYPTLSKSNLIGLTLATLLTIGLVVWWVMGLFPGLVRLSLQHYGVDSLATVRSYELVHHTKWGEHKVTSVTDADALNVKLIYNHRTSTVSIQKDDTAFNQVYSAATTGYSIPVRYLSWLSVIVLPKSDLGLPNYANVKP